MPLLRINASADGITLHGSPQPAARRLCAMAARPGPAIIMVHGFKYAPGSSLHCPHRKIFGRGPHSWPRHLGFEGSSPDEGLAIAFGWQARGSLKSMHQRAADLGESIAVIVALLRAHSPARPIHIIAHSLGSEAALNALAHLPQGAVDRIVLLTGASFAGSAATLLNTPAGRAAEVLNVTSRENDLFDAAFERLVPAAQSGDRAIGQGIAAPNVANIQLDCHGAIAGLSQMGFDVGTASKRVCHWSAYKRPGIMQFYNSFLRSPDRFPLTGLQRILPTEVAPRWSRLFARHIGKAPGATAILHAPADALNWEQHLSGAPLTRSAPNEPAY